MSKASGSSDKFMHGIKVLMAKNYVGNLSEEVKKAACGKRRRKDTTRRWRRWATSITGSRDAWRATGARSAGDAALRGLCDGPLLAEGAHPLRAHAGAPPPSPGSTAGHRQRSTGCCAIRSTPGISGGSGRATPGRTRLSSATRSSIRCRRRLGGSKRPRTGRRHAFMGLITCGRRGCRMTAERKKGRLRLLPLHRVQRRVWQHLHPRGSVLAVVGSGDRADPDYAGGGGRARRRDRRHGPGGGTASGRGPSAAESAPTHHREHARPRLRGLRQRSHFRRLLGAQIAGVGNRLAPGRRGSARACNSRGLLAA